MADMILKVIYTDNSIQEFDLNEYMYIAGEHCLTITKNIGWENYNRNTCETDVIPYANIYKFCTVEKKVSN